MGSQERRSPVRRVRLRLPHPASRLFVLPFSPLLERAVELAAEWHDGTYRKGRWRPAVFALPGDAPVEVPMMAHLMTVALSVLRAGYDDATVAAALLHDSVEDANRAGERLRIDTLRAAVGERVTALVLAVTEPKEDAAGAKLSGSAPGRVVTGAA